MKAIFGVGLTMSLIASSAIAQAPPAPPDDRTDMGRMMRAPPAPGGPAKSARFRIKVGDISLGLTCPDDEPLKVCADFAMQLLDKAQAMQKH